MNILLLSEQSPNRCLPLTNEAAGVFLFEEQFAVLANQILSGPLFMGINLTYRQPGALGTWPDIIEFDFWRRGGDDGWERETHIMPASCPIY